MSEPAPQTDWGLLKKLWPYVRRWPGWLAVVAVCTPLGVGAELLQPILLKKGIDEYIAAGDIEGLLALSALFMLVVTLGFAVRALGLYGLQAIGLRTLAHLRRDIFGHVMTQGQRFFDRRTTGALMTRTTSDVEAVYESLAFGAVGLLTDALLITGIVVSMLVLDWRLTLVAFSVAPLVVFVIDLFRRRLRVFYGAIRTSLSQLNGSFAEQIHGMKVVQLYGAQQRAREEFRGMAWHYADLYRRANWWDAALYAIMDGVSALAVGAMIAYGAYRFGVAPEGVTLGLLVAFIDYLGKVFVPIREFSGRIATLQAAVAALDRIFGLLETDERIRQGEVALPRATGHVAFDSVGFAYGPDRPAVLQDVSFEVKPGEVVALVGATGSGKSTIGKLLTRMYDGYGGSIRLDGHELREVALADVRRNITVVHQDTYLFDATVEENIALWDPEVAPPRVAEAAERARAAVFVEQLPSRYAHRVASRGGNLSAGQKQLLCIARAMARDAPIVILDEATASVDSLTEKLIDQAVEELFAAKTVVVIAHRLSTITKADRILVLHHGRLVEQGSHEELLARGGAYKLLVETGFAL